MTNAFFTIVNGAAGGGRCRARADLALAELRKNGLELEIVFTDSPGNAVDLAADAYADGYRKFLSVGGDGTAFEVVNGLFRNGTPSEVQLGLLPLGTGNSFLRDFGIESANDAISAIIEQKARPVDVIRVDHADGQLFYINTLGIGFVAKAGALTNEKFKPLGAAGYVAAVLTSVITLDYPEDPIRVDGNAEVDRRPAALISFSNSQFTGGAMKMAPHADTSDGKLDIIRVGKLTRLPFVATFPKIFAGTHVEHPDIDQQQVEHVEFLNDREQPVLIDGELRHLRLRALSVIPRSIEVFA